MAGSLRGFRGVAVLAVAAIVVGVVGAPSPASAADYAGTVSLVTDRTTTTPSSTTAYLTASVSVPVPNNYYLTIYDQAGVRRVSCSAGLSNCYGSASPALNTTETFTAYIAQTQPATGGPPTGDVHASTSVSVSRIGYTGTVSLATDRATTSPASTTAYLTANVSVPVPNNYYLTIYDQAGVRRVSCSAGLSNCYGSASPALNTTETFTAYVAQTQPATGGPPTGDVHASASVSVNRIGYTGTVSLVTDRATTTPAATSANLTASVSAPVPNNYYLTIYDQTGARRASCGAGLSTCSTSVSPALNTTETFTAYVAQTNPTTGGPPTGDVSSSANVAVNRVGYTGTVSLVTDRATTSPYATSATLTASVSVSVPNSYYLTIYDQAGVRRASCGTGLSTCSTSVSPALGTTERFTAYVAQTNPATGGPPTGDVSSSANVTVTRIGYTGTITLVTDRAWTSTTNPSATLTASVSDFVPYGYSLVIYDQSGVRRASCGPLLWTCSTSVAPAVNAVETFTAYVAQNTPATGPPTGDVHASGSVSVGRRPPAMPVAQTIGAGTSEVCECDDLMGRPGAPTAAAVGDPVNTATGAFYEQVSDAALPGAGTTFGFTRSYTSLDTTTGRLGPGWTDPYQAALTIPSPTSNITLRSQDGAQAVFTRNPTPPTAHRRGCAPS